MRNKQEQIIAFKEEGANKTVKQTKKVQKSLGDLKTSLMGAAAGYFGARALIAGITGTLDAYAEQEAAEKKLRFSLGKSANALLEHASAMQKQTTFGDEAIIQQQAFLASIGMTESQIMSILPVAADLAAATGMTLESAVRNTAKTFSGLAGELGELVPQLRDLTAEEMKAGKAVEVMAELFGGQAAVDANTYAGSIQQMSNAWGDMKESIGEKLAPVVSSIAKTITGWLEDDPAEQIRQQAFQFEALTNQLIRLNPESEERAIIIKELGENYPEYLKGLNLEKASTEELIKFQQESLDLMYAKIEVRAKEDLIAQVQKDLEAAIRSRISLETYAGSKINEAVKEIIDDAAAGASVYKLSMSLAFLGMEKIIDADAVTKELGKSGKTIQQWIQDDLKNFIQPPEDFGFLTKMIENNIKDARETLETLLEPSEHFDNLKNKIDEHLEQLKKIREEKEAAARAEKKIKDEAAEIEKKTEEDKKKEVERLAQEIKLKEELEKITVDMLLLQQRMNDNAPEIKSIYETQILQEDAFIKLKESLVEQLMNEKITVGQLNILLAQYIGLREKQLVAERNVKGLKEETKPDPVEITELSDIEVFAIENVEKAQLAANTNIAGSFASLNQAMGGNASVTAGLTIAQSIADTYAAANAALAGGVPPFNFITAAAVTASGLANVIQIKNAYKHQKKGQYGYEGIIDSPTTFTVGEGSAAEYVSVQPLEGVNNTGGGGIQIHITGNVMSEQFVEEELAEKISEAVRKGISFGIS